MHPPIGSHVGQYEIVAPLGSGGMGVVYRARDPRLGREVAIKILPEPFALDPDRVARFDREARALAALNHPHIAQIYGVEESAGVRALVMELVEGPTLAARIAQGPVPLDDALPIAKQIAEALEAAHEQGIIHRDLKPANIKLRPDGTVKVLDFGLAKALDPASPVGVEAMNSPTLTVRGTELGVILGTAAYMAPEQARGRIVDRRADIWAFGAVLYEMLTGRRAFEGDDVSTTLAAVLKDEVKWSALPAQTPESVRRLLRRCLQRDALRRLRDIGEARVLIEDVLSGTSRDVHAPAASNRTRERLWMAAAAVFALVAISIAGWTFWRPGPINDVVQFTIAPPEKNRVQRVGISISPDGRRLAFVAGTAEGKNQLWVRELGAQAPRILPGTEGAAQPFWSPDSRFVAFTIGPGGALKKVDLTGNRPTTLTDSALGARAWSTNGIILFTGSPDLRLHRVPDSGGPAVAVTTLDQTRQETRHSWPIFLPDGRRFIFQAQTRDGSKDALYLGSLDSPTRTHLVDTLSSVAYADGFLFYQRDGTLMAQSFDESAGRLTGDPAPVIEGVAFSQTNGRAAFSLSENGTIAYATGDDSRARILTWFDRQGKRLGTVGEPAGYGGGVRLSRDGRWLAVSKRAETADSSDIWLIDLERNVPTRLTSDPAQDNNPVWFGDTHVIFSSNRKGRWDFFERIAEGAGEDEIVFESAEPKIPGDVSPDGKTLLFMRNLGPPKNTEIWALPLVGGGKPFSVVSSDFQEVDPRFSPDGHWIAYQSNESGSNQVYVQPFPTGARVRVSTTTGVSPEWTSGGREIVYRTRDQRTLAVDVTDPRRPGVPEEVFVQGVQGANFVVDPSGHRMLIPTPDQAAPDAPITVVLNWTAGLRKR